MEPLWSLPNRRTHRTEVESEFQACNDFATIIGNENGDQATASAALAAITAQNILLHHQNILLHEQNVLLREQNKFLTKKALIKNTYATNEPSNTLGEKQNSEEIETPPKKAPTSYAITTYEHQTHVDLSNDPSTNMPRKEQENELDSSTKEDSQIKSAQVKTYTLNLKEPESFSTTFLQANVPPETCSSTQFTCSDSLKKEDFKKEDLSMICIQACPVTRSAFPLTQNETGVVFPPKEPDKELVTTTCSQFNVRSETCSPNLPFKIVRNSAKSDDRAKVISTTSPKVYAPPENCSHNSPLETVLNQNKPDHLTKVKVIDIDPGLSDDKLIDLLLKQNKWIDPNISVSKRYLVQGPKGQRM